MTDLPVLCCACAEREREMARLKKRILELEVENQKLRQQLNEALRSKRQITHFRRNTHKKRCRKPGQKPGHEASQRPTPEEVSRIIDAVFR